MDYTNCIKCSLCFGRTYIVNGEGNVDSKVMILGEAPGYSEDKQGRPFVGRSGKLLTRELKAVNLNREHDYFITNVVKCRPMGNRTPFKEEITACRYILKAEFKEVNPKIILALGSTAIETCFGRHYNIKDVRGQIWKTNQADILCTYHPSAVLRDDTGYYLSKFREDLMILQKYIIKYINSYVQL